MGKDYQYAGNPLIDIQVAHSKELILLTNEKIKIKNLIQKAVIYIKEKSKVPMPNSKKLNITKLVNKIRMAFIFANKKDKKKIKYTFQVLKRVERLNSMLNKIDEKIHKENKQSKEIKGVFITFQTTKDRKFFYNLLEYSWNHRFRRCLKKSQGFYIGGNMIYASKPPQPININWKNYSYPFWEKVKRRVVSWSVYFLLYLLRKSNSKISIDHFFDIFENAERD